LGGSLASATHTGRWRSTNDMDLYVLPRDRDPMIALLNGLLLRDIQREFPYDPASIYRATDGDAIVEVIWAMQNQRADVDAVWLSRAEEIDLEGLRVKVTAPEEIVWAKLYVLSRLRCDWPDILNLIYYCGHGMDWNYLLDRLGKDAPLLASVVSLLSWLSPRRLHDFPDWLLDRLDVRPPAGADVDSDVLRWRAALLSRHDWFQPLSVGEK
jgi:hypothetical protein